MRPGNREHVSHVAMHTPRTPLHLGRSSRVQRYSSSMHRAMEEDSLMIRHDDDQNLRNNTRIQCAGHKFKLVNQSDKNNVLLIKHYATQNIYKKYIY